MFIAEHTVQHQLEHELWLRELEYLNDEIGIMKRHLSDLYYSDHFADVMQLVEQFDEKFTLQRKWLGKMAHELQHFENETDDLVKKSFGLQMQANKIVNEELKNSFLKHFS